ncbi:MAG: 23S rRNA (uracil(1939)-C(5))-methyltransferase RlmD [Granulicella sp.]
MKLQIQSMFYGGSGLGRETTASSDYATITVPFTLPGEIVEATTIAASGHIISAELVAIEQPSPNRVEPRCPHFGACGGCQYQHASYAAQTQIKQDILRDTLQAAGLTTLPEPQLHTAEPWGYRNRIRLRVATVDGALHIGYNRRGSYEMLPIHECPIAAPLLLRAAEAVLTIATTLPTWARQLAEIELFTNSDQSRLQITFFLRSDRSTDLAAFSKQLQTLVPELAGTGITIVGASGRKEQPGASWGASGLKYQTAGREYWVSRGSFFQVNRFLVEELLQLVTADRSGALAWDLYAGVGLFSRPLAESFAEVVGVETVVGDLAAVLKGPGKRAVGATVADFLRAAAVDRDRPQLIVMDPPRAGLGPEVCELLSRIKAPQMVYISCDPVTLARDLKAMVDSGYTVNELHLVDLFPQTFHMETVAILNR